MNLIPKVLFVNHSVRDGGPGKSLFYLLKYLDRDRVNPYVMIPKDDVFSERLREEGLYENIIIDKRFPENLKRPRLFAAPDDAELGGGEGTGSLIFKFISIVLNILDLTSLVIASPYYLRKHGIDLIYCNGTQAKIVGALMGLFSGRPVIWHVRNIQQTKLLGSIIYTLARLPQVKKIVCVSGAAADQFPKAREKLIVIHNGIDEDEYDPSHVTGDLRSEFNIPSKTLIVGSTGRIVPRKGYPLFVEAARVYLENPKKKYKNVKFVIVGDTPYFFRGNHLSEIKSLVEKYGLTDYFIFTGYRPDVKTSLKDFDIFVIPSNYPDPFPRSVIEAMSFALPVIGFHKAGGIVEAIDEGGSGYLIDSGDTSAMGKAILKLAEDKELRESMGREGRERVKSLYSAKKIAKAIQENILGVLGL